MISDLLENHCPKVQKVAEADGVESGVKAIHQYRPDLILLDIKMDDGDGFDLLEKVGSIDFKVMADTSC